MSNEALRRAMVTAAITFAEKMYSAITIYTPLPANTDGKRLPAKLVVYSPEEATRAKWMLRTKLDRGSAADPGRAEATTAAEALDGVPDGKRGTT
jgi:hypothetical protein